MSDNFKLSNQTFSKLNESDVYNNILTEDEGDGEKVEHGTKQEKKYSFVVEDFYGNIKVKLKIINYGATMISCWLPNVLGESDDVLLGFDTLDEYRKKNAHFIGGTIGRVTDYITDGKFNYKGNTAKLTKNCGCHHYNGGENGFDKVVWHGHISDDKLVLTYSSPEGEEGYPGILHSRITYQLTCKNELVIDYVALSSKPTPLNLSSNIFFNLAGHDAGESEIMNHSLMVNADEYIVIKLPDRRPVGILKDVRQTCLDLRVPRLLKKAFSHIPGVGYNHTFKLFKGKEKKAFNLAASLVHKSSGRTLDVYTDMPCIHINTAQDFPDYGNIMIKDEKVTKVTDLISPNAMFGESGSEQHSETAEDLSIYSLEQLVPEDMEEGNSLQIPTTAYQNNKVKKTNPIIGKSKTIYNRLSGISIRPQLYPDAVTHKDFVNIILEPSNFYSQRVIYKFGLITNE
ncbi:galactose mutarotase-like isoform X2 [Adelges cooleyi]|uniref:galactose mutarotase-like isoform X2 n=1 Tax=Adelges cooleyi TaxID=133065 RepID=UPI00217FA0B8|nr:galactose mutarotase-like isoform X2 [Adelges cooleyi]